MTKYILKCSDHAKARMNERVIHPMFTKLCYEFGNEIGHNVKVLNIGDIPPTVVNCLPHSLKNRLEHQLPIAAIFSDDDSTHNYVLVTAYRVQEGKRIFRKHTLGTYMTKHSTFKNSYSYRHRNNF